MVEFHRHTLITALKQHPGWNEWFLFLDHQLSPAKFPTPEELSILVRCFLNCENCTNAALLNAIRSRFAIRRLRSRNRFGVVLPNQGWVHIPHEKKYEVTEELFGSSASVLPKIQIAVGKGTSVRRWSIEAHEIGHLFYSTAYERYYPSQQDHMARNDEVERYCWTFASELLCPRDVRSRWNRAYLDGLLDRRPSPESCRVVSHKITYEHIRELARNQGISIRMAVSLLDRHPLMSELSIGIAILKKMPNPATGQDEVLRVFMRARPKWGFLILNQAAEKQGFEKAREVLDRGKNQSTIVCDERLRLRYRNTWPGARWVIREIRTVCAYTPVDVSDEGRYIVAIWNWPTLEE